MTPKHQKQQAPDLTSVRTLVTSVTALARALNITSSGIYRWINVNRIPGRHIIKVANFYNVEVPDLLHLTGSDPTNTTKPLHKPRETLPTLLQVKAGTMSLEEAVTNLDLPAKSLHLIMLHWGDELPTLHKTLERLAAKEISIDQACDILKVAKYTLHGIRKKYGYAPGRLPVTKPRRQTGKKRATQRQVALDVIAGRLTADAAATSSGFSYRTIFRVIDGLTPHKLNALAHWPQSFRIALSEEIDKNLPNYAEKWLKFAEEHRLVMKKRPKDVQTPKTWKGLPLKRLLVGVLLGEGSLEEIAGSRGADPRILKGLFTSDLRPLDLDYDKLTGLPVAHQLAMAELLLAILDRKRRPE